MINQSTGDRANEFKGFGQAPVSNTGAKQKELEKASIEVGLDWIAGTLHVNDLADLMTELRRVFNDEFTEGKALGFYQKTYRSVRGILIGVQPYQAGEGQRHDCYVSLSGQVLASLSQQGVKDILSLLQGYSFHYSRLDLKLDDYTRSITPRLAYDAYLAGKVAGFRRHRWISSGATPDERGDTLELGRRGKSGGGKFCRIYDKLAESGGVVDCTRLELELSRDRCRAVADILNMLPVETWPSAILEIISGSIDFVDRRYPNTLRGAIRLDWWDKVVGAVGKAKLSVSKIAMTKIDQMKAWFKKQVAPTMATLFNAAGDSWDAFFWDCIFDGESRMQERHTAALKLYLFRNETPDETPDETPMKHRMKHQLVDG